MCLRVITQHSILPLRHARSSGALTLGAAVGGLGTVTPPECPPYCGHRGGGRGALYLTHTSMIRLPIPEVPWIGARRGRTVCTKPTSIQSNPRSEGGKRRPSTRARMAPPHFRRSPGPQGRLGFKPPLWRSRAAHSVGSLIPHPMVYSHSRAVAAGCNCGARGPREAGSSPSPRWWGRQPGHGQAPPLRSCPLHAACWRPESHHARRYN